MTAPTNWHWLFTDPVTSATYRVPRNPKAMTSPYGGQVQTQTLTSVADGRPRALTDRKLTEWTFSGSWKTEAHHDALKTWCEKDYPVQITDHLGRTWTVLITKFDAVPQRPTKLIDDRGNYTVSAYVLEGPS